MDDIDLKPPKKPFRIFGKVTDKLYKMRDDFQKSPFYKKTNKFLAPTFFIVFVISWILAFVIYGLVHNDFPKAANVIFVNALIRNFLGIGAFLIAILIAIGYKLDKRSWSDVFLGFIKGAIGVLILSFGSAALINTARPIFLALSSINKGGGSNITPLDPYFGLTSSETFLGNITDGTSTTSVVSIMYLALVFGFIFNLALVAAKRFTNLRTIFVTGHIMIQQSAIFSVVIFLVLFTGNGIVGPAAFWGTSILAGLAVGAYWAYGSSLNYYATQKVTDNAGFAVGHQQMIGIAIAYKVGKYFGRSEDNAENLRLPKMLRIFEDNIFTQTIIISVLFLIFILVIQYSLPEANKFWVWNEKFGTYVVNGNAKFDQGGQTGNFSAWSAGAGVFWFTGFIFGILKIVGSILIIVYGVRTFVTELQQSFQGISDRLIPNSSVGVDIAATFGYGQTSVTVGFFSGTVGQFIAVAIMYGISRALPSHQAANFPIVLPIFITLFFNSGAFGIYANKSGGIKAAIFVPFIMAFLGIFMITASIYSINTFFNSVKTLEPLAGVANADPSKVILPTPNPFSVGYNGMFDPNFFFGFLNALIGLNSNLGFFWVILWIILLVFLAQLIKYKDDEKQTYLYSKYTNLINKVFRNNLHLQVRK